MSAELVKAADWQTQIPLVKSMVARGATDEEFALMCHTAVKYGLDPLLKQIWVVKYGNAPANIFAGRDGFLSIAHRSGDFDGMNTVVEKVQEPIGISKTRYDKFTKEKVTISVKRPWQYKATCTIYKKGAEHAFITEVYEEEYTTGENLWVTKPRTMIAKVAESQNTRKAFNISGLYEPAEMPEPEEKDITPKSSTADAQAEFEKQRGITPQQGETPDIQPETPEQKAKREQGESRAKRLAAAPVEFREHVKAMKFNNKKIFEIMDANQDDPEALLSYVRENSGSQQTLDMPAQGEEGMPI